MQCMQESLSGLIIKNQLQIIVEKCLPNHIPFEVRISISHLLAATIIESFPRKLNYYIIILQNNLIIAAFLQYSQLVASYFHYFLQFLFGFSYFVFATFFEFSLQHFFLIINCYLLYNSVAESKSSETIQIM